MNSHVIFLHSKGSKTLALASHNSKGKLIPQLHIAKYALHHSQAKLVNTYRRWHQNVWANTKMEVSLSHYSREYHESVMTLGNISLKFTGHKFHWCDTGHHTHSSAHWMYNFCSSLTLTLRSGHQPLSTREFKIPCSKTIKVNSDPYLCTKCMG
jgi:hypothetical protein